MHITIAAGNDNRDARPYSPTAVEKAVTVGGSTLSDEKHFASNHGECAGVFAPGGYIYPSSQKPASYVPHFRSEHSLHLDWKRRR